MNANGLLLKNGGELPSASSPAVAGSVRSSLPDCVIPVRTARPGGQAGIVIPR